MTTPKGAHVVEPAKPNNLGDSDHLEVLGYQDSFNRSMSLWANFALGFTYLSPLVGVYSLFAVALHHRRPALDLVDRHRRRRTAARLARVRRGRVAVPDPRRHLPVGASPVGSPLRVDGGLDLHLGDDRPPPGGRRLRIAFVASLFGIVATPDMNLAFSLGLLVLALVFNLTGTKTLARVAQIGLAAQADRRHRRRVYLLIFQRKQEFSVFFDT